MGEVWLRIEVNSSRKMDKGIMGMKRSLLIFSPSLSNSRNIKPKEEVSLQWIMVSGNTQTLRGLSSDVAHTAGGATIPSFDG